MRVNKPSNIPLDDLTDFFIFNRLLQGFVNNHFSNYAIDRGEIICKIDVQSKGPIQLTGPIKKITLIGLICMFLCGGSIKLNKTDGLEISSDGIVTVIDSLVNAYDVVKTHGENDEYKKLREEYENLQKEFEECQQQLELSAPQIDVGITIPTEETVTE